MIRALSFVICTTGARDSFLDELVLPAILEQPVPRKEILLVGRYGGRRAGVDGVRAIEAPVGRELLHKPFQQGVRDARYRWVMDMDDDFVLASDWYERFAEVDVAHAPFPMIGCRLRNPDGTPYGGYFDSVDNALSGEFRAGDTYFASYVCRRELFRRVPYPSYPSGDRAHVQKVAQAGLRVTKLLADRAEVMNGGQSMQHEGLVARTPLVQEQPYPILLRALAERNLAWIPFADRFLEGQPEVTLADLLHRCEEVRNEPAFRRRHNWLL